MAFFALSCFGLLLFLWLSFGGTIPLKPKGYRFDVDFPSAVSLSNQADVRISGVSVGKVVALQRHTDRTRATLEIDTKYAPMPSDTRAILRSKTLLGETYVALTPGSPRAPPVPEGGALSPRNVRAQIELDAVLRAFDPPTRRAFHDWMATWRVALNGRGRDLNDVIGDLAPTATNGAGLLAVLDAQHAAVTHLVSDTGKVFATIGSRAGDVQTLITGGDRLFAATAARNAALSQTIRELPLFLTQTRTTLRTARAAAVEADPVVRALEPVASLLRPALVETGALAPDATRLFQRIDPLIALSRTALPAASHLLRGARPLVDVLLGVAEDLVPVVRYLGTQRDQVAAAAANVGAATNGAAPPVNGGTPLHYLRAITYFSPEGLIGYPQRISSNRRNPYLADLGLNAVKPGSAIKTYDCANLNGPPPAIAFDTPPPCVTQGPQVPGQFGGGAFPHLTRDKP